MTGRDVLLLAVSGLRGNAVRTLLSILGLSVGVGAVLIVLTLSEAGEIRVEEEITKLGVNKVWIRARNDIDMLAINDAKNLSEATMCPSSASTYTAAAIQCGDKITAAQIAGFDEQMQMVHGLKLVKGRLLRAEDHEQASCVCLVDEALAEHLGSDVVGQRISVGNRCPIVVGVVKKMSMQTMTGGSGLLIMPLTTYFDTFGGNVMEITMSVQRGQHAEQVAATALAVLGRGNAYRADTLTKEINAAREIVRIFVMVLLCVAVVCMFTGGIGVMNVLLLAVRERTREIGLMKAVGGTAAQVVYLFLAEAFAYAMLGGMLGLAVGVVCLDPLGNWIGLTAHLKLSTSFPVLLGAGLLGVVFGVIPALKAGRLDPITALQGE